MTIFAPPLGGRKGSRVYFLRRDRPKLVGPVHHIEQLNRDEFKHALVAELDVAVVYVGHDNPLPATAALRIHFPDLARLNIDHAPRTLGGREAFRSGGMGGLPPQPPVYSPLTMLISAGVLGPPSL